MRSSFVCSLVLVLCVFVAGCGGDPIENLAREQMRAANDIVKYAGDKKKTDVLEAKMKDIDEKVKKLTPDGKKKYDAAIDRILQEIAFGKK